MFTEEQGYGAYRGGNVSDINQVDSREFDGEIVVENESFISQNNISNVNSNIVERVIGEVFILTSELGFELITEDGFNIQSE